MAKEVNLYFPIMSYTADYIIGKMDEAAQAGEDLVMRVNSPGGSVFAGWGIAAKMKEMSGEVTVKVDGIAASMGAMLLMFADKVEMSDVARVMIHRASSTVSNEQEQQFLNDVNADLKAKMKAKIDSKKLKELKGYSIDQLFNSQDVVDVWLTAKEAKAVGLIDKIVKLSPDRAKALDDFSSQIAAYGLTPPPAMEEPKTQTRAEATVATAKTNTNTKIMTAADFQAQHPEAYNAIIKGAIAKERDRVNAWLKFVDVDAKAVAEGIASGNDLSQTALADFTVKMASANAAQKIEAEGKTTEGKTTEAEPDTQEPKAKTDVELFAEQVAAHLPKAEK